MSPYADQDHGPPSIGFAAALYAQRRAAGLTQEELATRAGLGVRTVRELERGRVSRPQRGTVTLLADALGLTGPVREAFVAAASLQRAADAPDVATGVLPPPIALVGRDADLADLDALLGTVGIVTLVGLAGVGKTCLAVAAAHRAAPRFRGGVAMIAVSDVSARDDLVTAAASAFGVPRAADLTDRFRAEPALLVVDGLERAPGASAAAIGWLRANVPAVRVLATGRHPLDIPGAVDWRVEPLDVPESPAGLDKLVEYPAVALFLARLRQVRRAPVAESEAAALGELVRRLGGLPLALELAAARGRVLDLPELLRRYGDRLLDLGAAEPDGQSLRDAVAASFRLLDRDGQYALRRLSVLRGRWSLELAEALLGDRPELDAEAAIDRLTGLGLVSVRGDGDLRFRLLDVVGDFALERCQASGELDAARTRHAEVVTALAIRVAADLTTRQSQAVAQLDRLNADIRAALGYSSRHLPHTALSLAAAITRWCRYRGRGREARLLLREILDDPRTAGADPLLRARAEVAAGMLAAADGDGPAALPAVEGALAVSRSAGDLTGEAAALAVLSGVWLVVGGYEEARRHGEALLALAGRAGRVREVAVAQNNLSAYDVRSGDLAGAIGRLSVAVQRAIDAGDERVRAVAVANLAEVARLDRRYPEAIDLGRRAVLMLAEVGDPAQRVRALGTVGVALAEAGRPDEARGVLDELRDDGAVHALVSGYVALARGDRTGAARSFAVAVDGLAGRYEARDVLDALVGLAAATPAGHRQPVMAQIEGVCANTGLTLLPRDRRLLGAG